MSKLPNTLVQLINSAKNIFQSLGNNQQNRKILITVSISAIGITIAAKYYLHLVYNRKRILNKTKQQPFIQMVNKDNLIKRKN